MGKSNSVRVGDGEGLGDGNRVVGNDSISGEDENRSMLATTKAEQSTEMCELDEVSETKR